MKKELPVAIGFVLGLSIIAAMFVSGVPWLESWKKMLDDWFLVGQAWMVAVGVVNLTQIHARRVSGKKEGWPFSIWLMVCMYGMIVYGVFVCKNTAHAGWQFMYNQLIAPMNATVYSTLMFYIGSAAYRAFRVRNLEATILLISAVIMMLGSVPLGKVLVGEWITKASSWLLNVPNSAAMRGITLGATLGAVSQAFRILVGIERGHLGGTGE